MQAKCQGPLIVIEGDGVYHAIAAQSITRITLVVAAPNVTRVGKSDRTARIFINSEGAPLDIDADMCVELTALWQKALKGPDPAPQVKPDPQAGQPPAQTAPEASARP